MLVACAKVETAWLLLWRFFKHKRGGSERVRLGQSQLVVRYGSFPKEQPFDF
jgi:hypothetical protein